MTAPRWRELASLSFASYAAMTTTIIGASVWLNHGTLVYSLDDPYIHLAIAKTWLTARTLGVSPGQFAPASSSPLWTLLLTCISAIVGISDFTPLALNVVSAAAIIVLFWWGVDTLTAPGADNAAGISNRWARVAALLLPALLNLPSLTLSGLEHAMHVALTLAFTIALWRRLDSAYNDAKWRWAVYALAALLPLARNEGLFTAAAGALLLGRRDRVASVILLGFAALPITLLGAFYMHHGAFFFPNSVVAKAVFPSGSAWFAKWGMNLLVLVFEPLLLWVVLFSNSRVMATPASEGFLFLSLIVGLHFTFAAFGGMTWLDRYESYLIDLGLFLFAVSHRSRPPATSPTPGHPLGGRGMRILFALGVFEKFALLLTAIVGSNDIYLQQYQMGRFVEQGYAHGNVVANDIGLVSLRAGGTVTDLAGLGSTDILRAIRKSPPALFIPTEFLSRASIEQTLERNGADFVVIYPEWFSPLLYGDWVRVASWSFQRRPATAAHETVVFFAVDEPRARVLYERLRAFEPQLPPGVRVEYRRTF